MKSSRRTHRAGADEATALQGGQAKNAVLTVADSGTALDETPLMKIGVFYSLNVKLRSAPLWAHPA
ncbi:MAG: hypothetical protein Q7T94_11390 [Rugosibacter sp.]|nr:hypothetical protein [Rugosibacter sp.]